MNIIDMNITQSIALKQTYVAIVQQINQIHTNNAVFFIASFPGIVGSNRGIEYEKFFYCLFPNEEELRRLKKGELIKVEFKLEMILGYINAKEIRVIPYRHIPENSYNIGENLDLG